MLYLGFAVRNPFSRRHEILRDYVFSITKNKTIELGFYKNNSIIGASFGITGYMRDHRGFHFDIELLGYQLDFIFYDNRHYGDE